MVSYSCQRVKNWHPLENVRCELVSGEGEHERIGWRAGGGGVGVLFESYGLLLVCNEYMSTAGYPFYMVHVP